MKYLAAILVLMTLPLLTLTNTDEDKIEYIISVIKQLDKYVAWPEGRRTEGDGKLFVVAVVGKSPIAAGLKSLNSEKTSTGRIFKIRFVTDDLLPANAHALIILPQDIDQVKSILKKIRGTGTLTIGVGEGFGELGAMLNFYDEIIDDKVQTRLEINSDRIKAEGLEIDSKLLEGASIIAKE